MTRRLNVRKAGDQVTYREIIPRGWKVREKLTSLQVERKGADLNKKISAAWILFKKKHLNAGPGPLTRLLPITHTWILYATACSWPLFSSQHACRQQGDLRLSGTPSGQGTGGGARTRYRRIPADIKADSLTTVSPTPLNGSRECSVFACLYVALTDLYPNRFLVINCFVKVKAKFINHIKLCSTAWQFKYHKPEYPYYCFLHMADIMEELGLARSIEVRQREERLAETTPGVGKESRVSASQTSATSH
ncbi:hypothetical protein PoB_006200300 [Plakobranchus ocellatus]|uniref:Uncharacterized protein n=1 Tax=Plakobranchus ocellatus TaxID=259542 RepID=A0AAV4CUH7_9GAST|nr:hypothetical protein PoB_006200300 [Plakobranchus ocellatus]